MFMRTAAAHGASMLPVDSEHNAIFQALGAGRHEDVSRVILTASGGPFRTWTLEAMRNATLRAGAAASELVDGPEDHHRFRDHDEQGPRTDRGASPVRARRRTSSTCWSIRSRSCTAWWSSATGRSWLSSALPTCASRSRTAWPGRSGSMARRARLDLAKMATLTFEAPDLERFPALAIARRALDRRRGGADHLQCGQRNCGRGLRRRPPRLYRHRRRSSRRPSMRPSAANATSEPQDIEEALAVDQFARSLAQDLLREIAAKAS